MSERNVGGPAFPHPPYNKHENFAPGMTLRDWFAGMALNGFPLGDMTPEDAADDAYELADAMLKARQP